MVDAAEVEEAGDLEVLGVCERIHRSLVSDRRPVYRRLVHAGGKAAVFRLVAHLEVQHLKVGKVLASSLRGTDGLALGVLRGQGDERVQPRSSLHRHRVSLDEGSFDIGRDRLEQVEVQRFVDFVEGFDAVEYSLDHLLFDFFIRSWFGTVAVDLFQQLTMVFDQTRAWLSCQNEPTVSISSP